MGTFKQWALAAGFAVLVSMCVSIGLYAYAFQTGMAGAPDFHKRFDLIPVPATMHVLGGGTVLLLGSFQFIGAIRRRYPTLHRNMGRLYLIGILIGGLGGLVLAPQSSGGLTAHFGFGVLAVAWLFSGAQAFIAIRDGRVAEHRAWMLRNFSMTFGAVTLRLYLGLFSAFDVPFESAYPVVAWLAWVPNLILVEWYLALRRDPRASRAHATTALNAA